jgi:hypothetical protein
LPRLSRAIRQANTTRPVSGIAHIRSYDLRVVALSVAIAVLGAYAGLDLAERVTAARGGARVAWLIGGVTATAIGIWSMHYTSPTRACTPFIGRSPVQYDWRGALLAFFGRAPRCDAGPDGVASGVYCPSLDGRRHLRPALHRHGVDARSRDASLKYHI